MTIGELCRLWTDKGHELYLVGGCVRDRILGRPTVDYDFATDTVPELTMDILRDAGLRAYPLGLEFGTVATTMDGPAGSLEVQITTFRCRESYSKGSRHPEVVFGGNLEEDLRRRDFTINAMAMDCSGKIIDPLGGRGDLERGLIRTPLDPMETFADDPLRMLRAFRFAAVLGFGMEEMTLHAVSRRHSLILDVSRERWKMEMDRLLTAADPASVSGNLALMRETGILLDMFPELADVFGQDDMPQGDTHTGGIWEHTLDAVSSAVSVSPCVRWGLLLHDIGKPRCRSAGDDGNVHFYGHESAGAEIADSVARRLRFSRKERNCLVFLVKNHMRPVLYSPQWSDRAVRKLARDAGEYLEELLDLAQSDIAAHAAPAALEGMTRLEELRRRLADLAPEVRRRVLPGELGRILMNRIGSDISRAPQVGIILSNLEELVHQGVLPELASPEVYLEYLDEHPEAMNRDC
jgi:poly(A) polymerase